VLFRSNIRILVKEQIKMDMKRITCWHNWKEWKSLMNNIYINDRKANERALARIEAWEARDADIPSAVSCLKELLTAKLFEIDKEKASMFELQIYQKNLSMSIVRFVNLITEPYQKSPMATPIRTIALEIGLPDWIVNLRHLSTHHHQIPSIEMLEQAILFLFDWIKDHYVDTYKEYSLDSSLLNNLRAQIKDAFLEYLTTQYKEVFQKKKKKSEKKIDTTVVISELTEVFSLHFKNETFKVLLEDGYLVPTSEQLAAIGIIAEEFVEQESINIPQVLAKIWGPFFKFCNENSLIDFLFEKLMEANTQENIENALRSKFLVAWILYFLKSNSNKANKFVFNFNCQEVLLKVLETRADKIAAMFLNETRKIPKFQREISNVQFEKITNLIFYSSGLFLNNENEMETNVEKPSTSHQFSIFEYTPLQIQERNQITQPNSKVYSNKKQNSIWKIIDDCDWDPEAMKLGIIEGHTSDSLDFNMIEEEKDCDLNRSFGRTHSIETTKESLVVEDFEKLKRAVYNSYWNM